MFLLASDFMPHGYCLSWNPELVWLMVVGNALVALSYYTIPLSLLFIAWKRKDIPFHWLFVLFAAFITACGTTHLVKIWTLWHPDYWVEGAADAFTGIISAFTAILLLLAIPKIIDMSRQIGLPFARNAENDKVSLFNNKFASGLVVTLLTLFILLYISVSTSIKLLDTRKWADHSHEVLQKIEETFSSVKDMENAYRGYAISGDAEFLRPYEDAVSTYKSSIRSLKTLTEDNAAQQTYISEAKKLIAKKIEFGDQVIKARDTGGQAAAAELVSSKSGFNIMEQIRQRFMAIKDAEQKLLTERVGKAESTSKTTIMLLCGLSILILLIFMTLLVSMYSYYAEREKLFSQMGGLQRAISSIKDYAIILLDPEGRVLTWNAGAELIKGYKAKDIIGASNSYFYTEEDRENGKPANLLKRAMVEGRVEEEGIRVRANGTTFAADVIITALRDEAGKLQGYIKVTRDITERRQAEEMAKKNNELELILQVASHDLKEPLRAIENFSQMVKDRYSERLDEVGADYLRRVVDGATRLNQLLDDLLSVSRARRIAIPTEEISLDSIVDMSIKRLDDKIKAVNAKITVQKPFPTVHVDSTWAVQAVFNLIANALKFTLPGQTPDIEVVPYFTDRQAGITVKDRGPGVKAEYAERIFQLFQRAVGREIEGTGAGLAIVQQIAERHGGRAWVQPRQDGGSEFTVTFGPPSYKREL